MYFFSCQPSFFTLTNNLTGANGFNSTNTMYMGKRPEIFRWPFIPKRLKTLSVLSTKSVKDCRVHKSVSIYHSVYITVHVCIKHTSRVHTLTLTCMKVHIYIQHKSQRHAVTERLDSRSELFKRREKNRFQVITHLQD